MHVFSDHCSEARLFKTRVAVVVVVVVVVVIFRE